MKTPVYIQSLVIYSCDCTTCGIFRKGRSHIWFRNFVAICFAEILKLAHNHLLFGRNTYFSILFVTWVFLFTFVNACFSLYTPRLLPPFFRVPKSIWSLEWYRAINKARARWNLERNKQLFIRKILDIMSTFFLLRLFCCYYRQHRHNARTLFIKSFLFQHCPSSFYSWAQNRKRWCTV